MGYDFLMATIHISDLEAGRDFASLLARVRAGAEIVIEAGEQPVAIVRPVTRLKRSFEECIALLPEHSDATLDEDFEADVRAAVEAHREPLTPPDWNE